MRIVGLLSILLLGIGLSLPAATTPAAATDTPIVPSPGGMKIIAQCDKGQAVVGYASTATQWLTSIGALCEAVEDGKVVPPVFKLKDMHGATTGAPAPAACPIGSAVTGLSLIYYPMKNAIRSFYAVCSKIDGGKAEGKPEAINESHFLPPESLGPVSPGDPSWTPAAIGGIACPEGQFATALLGGSANEAGFLGLGLRCSVGAKPTPPPEDDQATTDTGDDDTMTDNDDDDDGNTVDTGDNDDGDNGITVDTGDNGFKITIQIGPNTLKFGPQGKVRVANEPTTIYAKPDGKKELDYLDKGAKVTVLACQQKGKGWCQIVRPRPGFVWGGDLK